MQSTITVSDAIGELPRVEVYLRQHRYAPHRHDTYTIAITLSGVQHFHYRGQERVSLPGQLVLLHPDELHDGHTQDEQGFRYRSVSLHPQTMQAALSGAALPFVDSPVCADPRLLKAAQPFFEDYEREISALAFDAAIGEFTEVLSALAGQKRRLKRKDYRAADLARQYIMDNWHIEVDLDTLSKIADRDRWQLSRDFRQVFGTSPYQYLIYRRLEKAKMALQENMSLADAAAFAQFADQSHFTRHFKKAYGLTPGAWLKASLHH